MNSEWYYQISPEMLNSGLPILYICHCSDGHMSIRQLSELHQASLLRQTNIILPLSQRCYLMPRLHQESRTCRPETCCIPDEQLVYAGYKLFVRDTCWLYLGDIITIHSCHGRLVSFVSSSNRRATNWRQFYRRYKIHVDGDKWIQLVSGNVCSGVNAA